MKRQKRETSMNKGSQNGPLDTGTPAPKRKDIPTAQDLSLSPSTFQESGSRKTLQKSPGYTSLSVLAKLLY